MVMTLDGYLASPNNDLDWFHPPQDQDLVDDIVGIISSADTWAMGYPTAPGMVAYWSAVPNNPSASPADLAIANVVNKMHVVAFSNAMVELKLDNSELMLVKEDRDLVDAITQLKRRSGTDIYIPGGVRTGQKFARLGLVDEYILMVQPVAIAKGKPLFTTHNELKLTQVKPYSSGVVQLRYVPAKVTN